MTEGARYVAWLGFLFPSSLSCVDLAVLAMATLGLISVPVNSCVPLFLSIIVNINGRLISIFVGGRGADFASIAVPKVTQTVNPRQ